MGNSYAKITEDQVKGCTPAIGGNDSTLYLANRNEIAGYIYDPVDTSIIRQIVMIPYARFYKYEGSRTSLRPSSSVVKDDYGVFYKHEMSAVIFKWNESTKKEISKLAGSLVVAVVVSKDKQSNASVEVYGKDFGLYMLNGAKRDLNGADYGAGFPFSLSTEDGYEEKYFPSSFAVISSGSFSYTATMAALEALTVPVNQVGFDYTLNFTL